MRLLHSYTEKDRSSGWWLFCQCSHWRLSGLTNSVNIHCNVCICDCDYNFVITNWTKGCHDNHIQNHHCHHHNNLCIVFYRRDTCIGPWFHDEHVNERADITSVYHGSLAETLDSLILYSHSSLLSASPMDPDCFTISLHNPHVRCFASETLVGFPTSHTSPQCIATYPECTCKDIPSYI